MRQPTPIPHTPLPWELQPSAADHGASTVVVGPFGFIVCTIPSPAWDEGARLRHPRDRANARLIVQAPALVAAIEACLPDLRHYVSTHGPGPDRRLAALLGVLAEADVAEEADNESEGS